MPQEAVREIRPGRLIVVEGGDGAGRSTQVRLLLSWLADSGWPTIHAGLGRSRLASTAFQQYKLRPATGPHALALLYAADLADQAECTVGPVLAAGFAVVPDRWTGTAWARCRARGLDCAYLADTFPQGPEPDLVIHLYARPQVRLEREIARGGLPSIPESGRDMVAGPDPLRSFLRYQGLLDRELRRLAADAGWHTVSSLGDPRQVQQALRRLVTHFLGEGGGANG